MKIWLHNLNRIKIFDRKYNVIIWSIVKIWQCNWSFQLRWIFLKPCLYFNFNLNDLECFEPILGFYCAPLSNSLWVGHPWLFTFNHFVVVVSLIDSWECKQWMYRKMHLSSMHCRSRAFAMRPPALWNNALH